MMELNLNAPSSAGANLIKDVSEATFMADVVEASQTVPVIVDFWAASTSFPLIGHLPSLASATFSM